MTKISNSVGKGIQKDTKRGNVASVYD